jgi:undecaprenyl-diphosphatase
MIIEAIILGILQGLTEFLPISSSGHLVLAEWAIGWKGELLNNLTFDVALHAGTLVAVLWYFRRDWFQFGGAVIKVLRGNAPEYQARLVGYIALATIPAVIAGLRYEDMVEKVFRHPLLVAAALVAGSFIMWFADRHASQFSFLLSTPIIAGAAIFKLREVTIEGHAAWGCILGTLCAAVVGYLAIRFLIRYLERHSLNIFVWYRLVLAALAVLFWAVR